MRGTADFPHLPSDFCDNLLAFPDVRLELNDPVTPDAAQGELENGEQLRR